MICKSMSCVALITPWLGGHDQQPNWGHPHSPDSKIMHSDWLLTPLRVGLELRPFRTSCSSVFLSCISSSSLYSNFILFFIHALIFRILIFFPSSSPPPPLLFFDFFYHYFFFLFFLFHIPAPPPPPSNFRDYSPLLQKQIQ